MKNLITAVLMTIVTTVLLGLIYPLAVTGLSQIIFPDKANGSLIKRQDGTVIGSRLIGQPFSSPGYFRSRPSAAGANGYDAGASSGSNLGPTSQCVIMSTAYASIELAVDAMKLGATDFVRKPMTPEILRNAVAAALAKQRPMSPATAAAPPEAEGPLIQTITMNGFTIVESEGAGQAPDERRFTVESPGGDEHDVLVKIDEEAIGYVERMTRRLLPAENSFWTAQAQRLLSDYLWNEGKVPPKRKLTVKDIDPDELPIAARWSDGTERDE